MSCACSKTLTLSPITGHFDIVSAPEHVAEDGHRYRLNVESLDRRKTSRMPGWQKLLADRLNNNADFHDQLGSITGHGVAPLNLIKELQSQGGNSYLYIGTPRTLAALNTSTGNYVIVSDLLGATLSNSLNDPGWSLAQVYNTVVVSNGVDRLKVHSIGQGNDEDGDQAVAPIPELEEIALTQALFVVAYRDIVMAMNVTMDGVRVPNRVVWSDIKRPMSWVADAGVSAAGYHDLPTGHHILGAAEMNNALFIYTTRGIWQVELVGGEAIFSFGERYKDEEKGNRCLAHRRTLVDAGHAHYYFGRDGIYKFDIYSPVPERAGYEMEWMRAGSGDIFRSISANGCNVHCGGYDAPRKSLWFSWAEPGHSEPNRARRFNLEYQFASDVDHGFTAFGNWGPDFPLTIREWLVDNCICSIESLEELGLGFQREGGLCTEESAPSCSSYPAHLYSDQTVVIDGETFEDFDAAEVSADSLCALLGDQTDHDVCDQEIAADDCNAERVFIGCSSTDFSLKEIGGVYFRHRVVDRTGCGTYVIDGYESIWRSGPIMKGETWASIEVQCQPAVQTPPSTMLIRVGGAEDPHDPNGDCGIIWRDEKRAVMECAERPEAEHKARNTRPGLNPFYAALYRKGRYHYYELRIDGVGGACDVSSVTVKYH
jgi:hypothetical protein